MATIHSTAIIEGNVTFDDDVVVGPNCVIRGDVAIGAGTALLGNVYLQGPLTMGRGNRVYPFACLGFAPQHRAFDHDASGRGVVIGDDNIFRESSTIHRAFTDAGPTTLGDRAYIMGNAHIGHDCVVGNDLTMVQGSVLAGHVVVGDSVLIGGLSGIHQFCRVGTGAMLAGTTSVTKDVLPWFTVTEINYAGSLNLIGMRRSGMDRRQIDDARWAYQVICHSGRARQSILDELRSRAGSAIIDEYVDAIEASTRGFCAGRSRASHGSARRGTS